MVIYYAQGQPEDYRARGQYITCLLAPVCNPTLQVIGLQIPCMEKAGVALDAFQAPTISKIKILIHTLFPPK